MAKWNFAIAVAALFCALEFATVVNAQSPGLTQGCVLLGELVRQAAVDEIRLRRGEPIHASRPSPMNVQGTHACNSTTSVVSSGFAAALGQFGIRVRWAYSRLGADIACSSHNLAHCHPLTDPMGPPMTLSDLAFVADSWNRVRGAVTACIPWGTLSDVSCFRAATKTRNLYPAGSGPMLSGIRTSAVDSISWHGCQAQVPCPDSGGTNSDRRRSR